ncbi:zinc finger protein 318 isoform X2 [Amia ocellicauda]|uniref:zinc finger protein 318 isoform X2 n=1 Tax=Amia ocellicauda TaxID=2972642 RepID=UPI0034641F99
MFRGRPHREDYPRHYAPRGPPGSSPPPHGPYRDDRERDRHYFVPDYHREPAYRRSPPGRRYPSPGREHNRGPMSEFRGSGPPPRDHPPGRRPSPLAPHGSIPIDHSLVITVGNELTLADHRAGVGADPRRVDPRKGPPEHLYDREETDEEYLRALASKGRYPGQDLDVDFHGGSLLFPPRREENSGIVSKEREGYTKPPYDPKDAKRPGYEVDPEGRGYRHMERPPESRRRSCSRGRSRSKARSPSRGKSRGRSPSRGKSRGRSRSTSQGKSRGRSPSRGKSRGRSRSRGKSRGRSRGRSRSHSRSRSRSRGKSSHRRSRSKSRAKSRGRSKSRTRGKSRSRSSSGSNRGRGRGRGGPPDAFDSKTSEGFRELELARRRKEQEELERMEYEISQRGAPGNVAGSVPAPHQSEEVAQMPKKSILKKRIEPEIDQQSIQSDECFSESSLDQRNSILSKETERFLNTLNKGIDSGLFSSLLREAREEGYGQMIQKQMSKSSSSYEEQFEEPYNRVKQEKPVESFGEFLLPHERVSQDGSGFSRILGMMSEFSNPADRKKGYADIEDEEKFLYGENEDEREPAPTPSQSVAAVPRQPSQPNIGQYRESRSGIADCRLSQPGMSLQQHSKNVASLNLLGKAGSGDHLEERSVSSPRQQNQPSLMHRQQSQPMPASEKEAKMGIPHRQLSQPEKVHHQQSQPGSYPPGPHQKSPQEEAAETQDSQEFEKIHDLLKTIGLDIGMAEISKLAARTQERLHGKKPQARSSRYTDRQRDGQGAASGTWDKQRSRSGSSHAKSPDSEYSRSISPPPTMRSSLNEPPSMHRKSEFQLQGDEKKSWGIPVLGDSASQPAVSMSSATMSPTTPQPIPVPANSVHALPGYAQYQPQPPPTPSYPPPGYDQYGNYMSYVPSGWPMYPPAQSHSVPPPQEDHQLPSSHSYLRVIETVNVGKGTTQPLQEESALVHVPVLDNVDTSNRVMLVGSTHQQRVSEEKNNADQKQKVIEEREKLKKERDARMKKKEYLMKELERLRKQQGELLRKKRREKDGHKDPLLVEVSRLQEEVMVQISLIRKEHEAAEKKRSELDKVALILGLHGSDKHRKEPKDSREFQPEKRREKPRSPEKSPVSSSNTTSKESSSSKPAPEKPKSKSPNRSQSPPTSADRYEYYDAGNHWCKNCNTICGSMFDFFTHMHSKTHRKTQDPYDRPWAPKTSNMNSILRTGDKIVLPSKGSEFLIPVIGFYCQLCEEFYGDQICAEDHVTCHIHNVKYKKYIEENPLYEQRRNLDRQAGLAAVMDNKERKRTELKRKMEEEPKTPKEEDRKQKTC